MTETHGRGPRGQPGLPGDKGPDGLRGDRGDPGLSGRWELIEGDQPFLHLDPDPEVLYLTRLGAHAGGEPVYGFRLAGGTVVKMVLGGVTVWPPDEQVVQVVRVVYPGYNRDEDTAGHTAIGELNWQAFTEIVDYSVGLHGGTVSATWVDDESDPDGNGWTAGQADELVAAAHAAGRRAVLCLGGRATSGSFAEHVATAQQREDVASDLADLVETHGYDGVDLAGSPAADIDGYLPFVAAVVAEWQSRGWRSGPNRKSVTVTCLGTEVTFADAAVAAGADLVSPMLYIPS